MINKEILDRLFKIDEEKTKLGRSASESIFGEDSKEIWYKLSDGYSLILENDGRISVTDAPWIKVRDLEDLVTIKKWISR